jgi:hypothetical protein
VFNFYDNFAGTTVNPEWSQIIPSGTTISQNNGIIIGTDSTSTYGGLILTSGYTGTQIFEGDITAVSGVAAGLGLQNGNLESSGGVDFNYWGGSVSTGSMSGGMVPANNNPNLLVSTGIDGGAWLSSSSQVWYKNYVTTTGSQTAYSLPSTIYPAIGIWYSSSSTSITFQWLRTRAYPPNGVMPSTAFGVIQGGSPSVTVSPSSVSLLPGTGFTLTADVSNGTSPYTYQWYNATSGTGIPIAGATSSTYTATAGSTAGTFDYFVKVTDLESKTVQSSNSVVTVSLPPSGITYYVPITLTNSQSTATPSPFQQMVNISESTYSSYLTYNGNFANFEFFTSSGTVIPAWIESNNSGKIITWIKLPNGIPAKSSITIYLGFASKSNNLLSSSGTTGIGEAPQLPCGSIATSSCSTYAEYDDGASVFNNYWNFAGTTTPNGWVQSGVGIVQNNGVTVSESTGDGTLLTSANTYGLNANSILDFYGSLSTASQNTYTLGAGYMTGPGGISGSSSSDYGVGAGIWGTGTNWYVLSVSGGTQSSIDSGILPSAKIVSIYWATTSGATISFNYTDPNIITTDIPTTKTQIGIGGNNQETQTMTIQYMRIRAYPPNGVMPIKNFKQMQNITYINTTPNPAPYGQNIAITATCPTGDTCTVQSPLGVTLATGTTTATYKISGGSAEDAPGNYIYYANDINTGKTAMTNLVILNQLHLPYTIPGNYIFTVPTNVISLIITAVAGGAGGGGGASGYGGGSGWSVVNKSYSVTSCEHIPITVGAAGGSIGGNTIVGNLVTLQGAIGQEGQLFGGYGGAAPSYYYGGNGASADPGYPFGTGGNGDILQVGGGTSYGAGSATGYGSGGGGGGGSGSGGEVIITNMSR